MITWGTNDVPVVPGQTYMLKIWRDQPNGMNAYHVINNNYAGGQYYEGTTALPGYDLHGWVCCMDYGPPPPIHITSGPTVTAVGQNSATVSWDTDVASNSQTEYGLSSSYGLVASDPAEVTHHSLELSSLTAESVYHLRVTSAAAGYTSAVSSDVVFTTAPLTPIADFDGDLDVDMEDFAHLQNCLTGPNFPVSDSACFNARLDADMDIDGDDVAVFLTCLSGPGKLADKHCGGR